MIFSSGSLVLNGSLTFLRAGTFLFNVSDLDASLGIGSTLSGGTDRSLLKVGAGTLLLPRALATYQGTTSVNAGVLQLDSTNPLQFSGGSLFVNTNGVLDLKGYSSLVPTVVVAGGSVVNGTLRSDEFCAIGVCRRPWRGIYRACLDGISGRPTHRTEQVREERTCALVRWWSWKFECECVVRPWAWKYKVIQRPLRVGHDPLDGRPTDNAPARTVLNAINFEGGTLTFDQLPGLMNATALTLNGLLNYSAGSLTISLPAANPNFDAEPDGPNADDGRCDFHFTDRVLEHHAEPDEPRRRCLLPSRGDLLHCSPTGTVMQRPIPSTLVP
jgi:autotransporter-associated beta strand protein